MISASVGFQCPECVHQGARQTRQNELPFGGRRVDTPLVTYTLLGINIAVWAAILATGGDGSWLADLLSIRPGPYCAVATDASRMYDVGQVACEALPQGQWVGGGVAGGQWWQLITSAFAHIAPLHLGMNMLALWFLGPTLERSLGRVRFLAVYLLSALAGSVAVMWFANRGSATLGASGAIFGLMGAYFILAKKVGGDIRTVMFWLFLNVAFTFTMAGVSWQGHIGGLIGGLVAALAVVYAPKGARGRFQTAGLLGWGLLMVVSAVVRVVQLS